MKKIIVISGKQFSGKDTFAKMLLKKLEGFSRIGIGDAIKLEYGQLKGLSFDEIEKNKSLYRADLIELGNKGRAISPHYWLQKIIDMDEGRIVPDIRLKEEMEIFKKAGAIAIRVEASTLSRSKRGFLVNENDKTETDLDDYMSWDFVVQNNGTESDLKQALELIYPEIKRALGL